MANNLSEGIAQFGHKLDGIVVFLNDVTDFLDTFIAASKGNLVGIEQHTTKWAGVSDYPTLRVQLCITLCTNLVFPLHTTITFGVGLLG